MKSGRNVTLAIITFVVATAACGQSINRYYPKPGSPRMIYFADQVQNLKTDEDLTNGKQVYTEVQTKQGKKSTGMLVRIDDTELVLNKGYYYSEVDESLVRFESQKVIPKKDILILRVW